MEEYYQEEWTVYDNKGSLYYNFPLVKFDHTSDALNCRICECAQAALSRVKIAGYRGAVSQSPTFSRESWLLSTETSS